MFQPGFNINFGAPANGKYIQKIHHATEFCIINLIIVNETLVCISRLWFLHIFFPSTKFGLSLWYSDLNHILCCFSWPVTLFCLLAKAIFYSHFESVKSSFTLPNKHQHFKHLKLDLDVGKHYYVHTDPANINPTIQQNPTAISCHLWGNVK